LQMISDEDKNTIIDLAEKYKVTRLLLFGSSIGSANEANDIDLAVEGLPGSLFFKFYSELIFNLSKPVDLIDIGKESRLKDMIIEESISFL
jgi:predicted nucleotidyltransferase